jgi:hypothetical protein
MNDDTIKRMLDVFYMFDTGIYNNSVKDDVQYLDSLYQDLKKYMNYKEAAIKAKTIYIKERLLK